MEDLDFTNIVQLMEPFIGKPIGLAEGSNFAVGSERILLSVDTGFKIKHLCDGKEVLTDKNDLIFPDVVKYFTFEGFSVNEIIEQGSESVVERLRALQDALWRHKPDIYLVCSDGRKVPAHRTVLASRSRVFNAIITVEMQEKDAPEVYLKENSFEAVEVFVQLLYSKTPRNLRNHILEVIGLADVYKIASLCGLIGGFNLETLSTCENAVDIFVKATERRRRGTWNAALRFIAKNPVDIKNSELWKEMERTGSTMELDARGLYDMLKCDIKR